MAESRAGKATRPLLRYDPRPRSRHGLGQLGGHADVGGRGQGLRFITRADLTITNNVVHDQAGNLVNGVYLLDVVGATVSGNTFVRDRNAGYTNIAVLGSSTNITLSKNTWQDSLDPAIAPGIPYPYLRVDPTVINLTDDGGIPLVRPLSTRRRRPSPWGSRAGR